MPHEDGGARRRRWLRAVLVFSAVAVAVVLARGWPRERTVRYILGDRARGASELEARWSSTAREGRNEADSELRTVSFRFPLGEQPRVITQEIRLPDGVLTVDIVLVAGAQRSLVRRRVILGARGADPDAPGPLDTQGVRVRDDVISIDLAAGLPPAHDVTLDPRPPGPR